MYFLSLIKLILLSFIRFIWLWFENQSLNMLRHDFFIILYIVYKLNIYDMGYTYDMLLHIYV